MKTRAQLCILYRASADPPLMASQHSRDQARDANDVHVVLKCSVQDCFAWHHDTDVNDLQRAAACARLLGSQGRGALQVGCLRYSALHGPLMLGCPAGSQFVLKCCKGQTQSSLCTCRSQAGMPHSSASTAGGGFIWCPGPRWPFSLH